MQVPHFYISATGKHDAVSMCVMQHKHMVTGACNWGASVQKGKEYPISAKIFYSKNYTYSSARLTKWYTQQGGDFMLQ